MLKFLKQLLTNEKPTTRAVSPQPCAQAEDADEELLTSISAYRKKMFEAAERALAANQQNAEEDDHKVRRAERFLNESGLDRGTANFLTTVWSTRSDAEQASIDNPTPGKHGMQLTGGGASEGGSEWITFRYGRHHYKIENRPKDWSNSHENDGYRYGEGSIFCDEVEVLRIETRQHYSSEYFLWKYNRILALRKGDWIPEIVELFTKFEIEDDQLLSKLMIEAKTKQAREILD
jgi:hypothetical protein